MAKTAITRAAFDSLTMSERDAHIRAGGRVVDSFDGHTPGYIMDGMDRMRAGSHAQREWAARYADYSERGGFPKMRETAPVAEATPTATPEAGGGSATTRREVFAHLLAGGSRHGLPEDFVADFDRSKAVWAAR